MSAPAAKNSPRLIFDCRFATHQQRKFSLSYLYLKADIFPDLTKREEVEAAYRELITASLDEPGCLLYDLVVDDANPSVWHMFEKWQSREVWDRHMASAHVAKIQSIESGLTVKATVLNFYDSVLAPVSH